jgi:hypothetical protein
MNEWLGAIAIVLAAALFVGGNGIFPTSSTPGARLDRLLDSSCTAHVRFWG